MDMKPNRPVRVGTKMVVTDADGNLPGASKPKKTGSRKAPARAAKKPAAPVQD